MQKIKCGDVVVAIAGKNKGSQGKLLAKKNVRVNAKVSKNMVLVEGLNIVKRHQKPTQQGQKGQIVSKEAYIDMSNIALWNPLTQKADKVKIQEKDGKKIRVFKSSGEAVDE